VVTPACKSLLDQMIATGVGRMRSQGVLENEPQVRLAEENIGRCLREFGDESVELKTFPKIEDKTYHIVMKRLCPVWPYC